MPAIRSDCGSAAANHLPKNEESVQNQYPVGHEVDKTAELVTACCISIAVQGPMLLATVLAFTLAISGVKLFVGTSVCIRKPAASHLYATAAAAAIACTCHQQRSSSR